MSLTVEDMIPGDEGHVLAGDIVVTEDGTTYVRKSAYITWSDGRVPTFKVRQDEYDGLTLEIPYKTPIRFEVAEAPSVESFSKVKNVMITYGDSRL